MHTEITVLGPVLGEIALTHNTQLRTIRLSTWEESYETESYVFSSINTFLQSVVSPCMARLDLGLVYLDLTTMSDAALRGNMTDIATTLSGPTWSNLSELNLGIAFGEGMPPLVRMDVAEALWRIWDSLLETFVEKKGLVNVTFLKKV